MNTTFLTNHESQMLTDILEKDNIVLTEQQFWYTLSTFIPRSRLQEIGEHGRKAYKEYRENKWLEKTNFF